MLKFEHFRYLKCTPGHVLLFRFLNTPLGRINCHWEGLIASFLLTEENGVRQTTLLSSLTLSPPLTKMIDQRLKNE